MMAAADTSGNAMTEIALALAMAFFAIMILTMVSMGASDQVEATEAGPETVRLVPAKLAVAKDNTAPTELIPNSRIVIFARGQFYDGQLQLITPTDIALIEPPILAVSQDLTLSQILAAKRRLPAPDIAVTTLDQRWVSALKELKK